LFVVAVVRISANVFARCVRALANSSQWRQTCCHCVSALRLQVREAAVVYRPAYRAAASTRVLVTFYFRLKIFISGCSFFVLLEYMETWGFANTDPCMLVQDFDPSGPRYADPPPVLRHWQLVLKYFRY